jgi:hypothetical protein
VERNRRTINDHELSKFTRQSQVKTTGHAFPRVVNTYDVNSNLTRSDNYTATREITNIEVTADIGGSLNNKYFIFYSALDAITYYSWFNVNAGGTDPAPGGIGVEVAIASNSSSATVKEAVISAINLAISTNVRARSLGTSILELANQGYGVTSATIDGNTTFNFTRIEAGGAYVLAASTLITYDVNNNPTEVIRLEHI